jgi:hypothetical protein
MRRVSAPMMIDFPAPVSPERMVSPGGNEIVTWSMMAKFFMCSSVSTAFKPGVRGSGFVIRD